MPHRTSAVVLGHRRRKSIDRLRTARPITAVAVVVAAQLGNAGLATDAAGVTGPRLTTMVSIDGSTSRWTPTETPAATPAAPVTTDPATAPPAPAPSVVATTPPAPATSAATTSPAPETITPTTTGAAPVGEVSSPNQPQP